MASKVLGSLVISSLLLLSTHAKSNDIDTVYALIADTEFKKANEQIKSLLEESPNDPNLIFAQAVIQDKMGQTDKALAIYQSLTQSHPELIEPYNNIAIQYADAGDYQRAIETLELALKANPATSTAYSNLTAIYARLAGAAYRKALNSEVQVAPLQLAGLEQIKSQQTIVVEIPQLVASVETFANDSTQDSPTADQPESTVIETSLNTNNTVVAANTDASNVDSSANAVVIDDQSTSTQPATVNTTPTIEPEQPAVIITTASIESTPVVEEEDDIEVVNSNVENAAIVLTETNTNSNISENTTGTATTRNEVENLAAEKQALIDQTKSWASAWSARDVAAYLSHYSSDFKPRDGLSLTEWREQRHGRLRWREFIIVEVSQYRIKVERERATVNFVQYYKSDRFEDTINKTLIFSKQNDQWLITEELI